MRGREVKGSRGREVKRSRGQGVERSRGREVKGSRGREVKGALLKLLLLYKIIGLAVRTREGKMIEYR